MTGGSRTVAAAGLPDRLRRNLLAVLGASLLAPGKSRAAAPESQALPGMRRGLNLTQWFEYRRDRPVSAGELRRLKALGLDHVRIPVDPAIAGWNPSPGGWLAFQTELEQAVALALDARLEVVVDLHLNPEAKERIEGLRGSEDAVGRLWTGLAKALADLPADRVAFELFNEPQYYAAAPSQWPTVQRRLLQSVRAVAPRHLVLLTAPHGSSLEALLELVPERGDRLAYVFHDYEPMMFTHQGASWLDPRYTTAGLRSNIRYPVESQAGATPGLASPHPRAAREWADYLEGGWNARRARERIDRAGAWAREHEVKLVCNEFGVIRRNVDPLSRYRWIADRRTALEANDIGWTLWDYAGIFGVVADAAPADRAAADREIEPAALAALGLVRPPEKRSGP